MVWCDYQIWKVFEEKNHDNSFIKDVEFEKSGMAFWSKQNGHESARQSQQAVSLFSGAVIQGSQFRTESNQQLESIHKLAVQESSPKRHRPFKVLDSDSD